MAKLKEYLERFNADEAIVLMNNGYTQKQIGEKFDIPA